MGWDTWGVKTKNSKISSIFENRKNENNNIHDIVFTNNSLNIYLPLPFYSTIHFSFKYIFEKADFSTLNKEDIEFLVSTHRVSHPTQVQQILFVPESEFPEILRFYTHPMV